MNSSNKKKSGWLQRLSLHPLLFAMYPILALLAFNISEIEISSGIRPLILSVFASGVFASIFYLISRDWKRAALISTILLILF